MKLSIFLSVLSSVTAIAAPYQHPATELKEWSFTQAFDYAISKGGPLEHNIVAQVIKHHVEKNKLDWSSDYSDIVTDDGATLYLAPNLRPRAAKPKEEVSEYISKSEPQRAKRTLEKRQNWNGVRRIHITGYIYSDNCSGSTNDGSAWQWRYVTPGCYNYVINGNRVSMYSLKIETIASD